MKTINIHYFALLREERGCSEETLETQVATPLALYQLLRERHGFRLEPKHLRVAVNEIFSDWNAELNSGDVVVFIPPVAGG